jgi:hypothetical protein
MQMNRCLPGRACLSLLALVASAAAAQAQQRCAAVHFKRGMSSAVIHGVAPPNDVVCYEFGARAGQTVSLKVAGNNMIISVYGVGDARDSWTFTTQARTYKFVVGQLMRSAMSEPYAVTLSIR